MKVTYTAAAAGLLLGVALAMGSATAQAQSPTLEMATDFARTCRLVLAPTDQRTTPQELLEIMACWGFIGGMRGAVTIYENVILGGPQPRRSGGRVICMPDALTFAQIVPPIANELRRGNLAGLHSHALIFTAWARAFPCS
jgi:hypothetical protein